MAEYSDIVKPASKSKSTDVTNLDTLADIQAGATGVFQVGNQLYFGDGVDLYSNDGMPVIRNIANRCAFNFSGQSTGVAYINSRSGHRNFSDITQTALKVTVQNYISNEVTTTSAMSVKAAIEYPAGTYTRLQFSGADTGSASAGTILTSDFATLARPIPPGALFWVRIFATNLSGVPYSSGQNISSVDSMYYSGAGSPIIDATMGAVSAGGGSPNPSCIRPLEVIGYSNNPAIVTIGDSRCAGLGDSSSDNKGNNGYLERAYNPYFAHTNLAVSGDSLNNFMIGSQHIQRGLIINRATHIICEYGINDITALALPLATVQSNISDLSDLYPTKKIYLTTLDPYTTGAWTATNGLDQIVHLKESVRVAYNTWVRGGAAYPATANICGYFDVASILESSANPGKWVSNGVPGYTTTDGVHASTTGNVLAGIDSIFKPWLLK